MIQFSINMVKSSWTWQVFFHGNRLRRNIKDVLNIVNLCPYIVHISHGGITMWRKSCTMSSDIRRLCLVTAMPCLGRIVSINEYFYYGKSDFYIVNEDLVLSKIIISNDIVDIYMVTLQYLCSLLLCLVSPLPCLARSLRCKRKG
jgi:hypothetical protein